MNILGWLLPKPKAVLVIKTGPQSIPNNEATAIAWDLADYDDAGMWNKSSPTKLSPPWWARRVKITAAVTVDNLAGKAATWRVALRKNGKPVRGQGAAQIFSADGVYHPTMNICTGPLNVARGDYFEIVLTQTTGGDENVVGEFNSFFSSWASLEAAS